MNKLEPLLKRLIEFGLLTDEEEKQVHESLLRIECHWSPKTKYIEFIDEFNKITGKKYRPDEDSRGLYYENDALFSFNDRITALKNALTDPWIMERLTIVTPKWILTPENLSKYINYAAPKTNKGRDGKSSDESAPERKSVI
jgi:hypothetical protein